jgi:hypothetical protein
MATQEEGSGLACPLLILAVLGSNNLPEIRQSLREWEARRVVEGIS